MPTVDLNAILREGFSLAADCTPAQARSWLVAEARARALMGPELADLVTAAEMGLWREQTGTCPTCGMDPQTHQPLDW